MARAAVLKTSTEWRENAACKGKDPTIFFPDGPNALPAAKLLCESCPVRFECLDEAVANDERGTWGGMGENQRRPLKRVDGAGVLVVCGQCGQPFHASSRRSKFCKPCAIERDRQNNAASRARWAAKQAS